MADLEKNVFENISTVEDVNGGSALADSIGGKAAMTNKLGGLNASLMSSLKGALGTIASASLGNLNFSMFSDLMSKFKLDSLLDIVKNAMKSGLSIKDSLFNALNGFISGQLSALKGDASETFSFLQKASGTFGKALVDKVKGVLISNIFISEEVFLAGLKAIKPIKSNIEYENNYIRKLAINKDMAKVLAFVDSECGVRYSNTNTKSVNDAITAANKGSFNVAEYILGQLFAEYNELLSIYPKVTGDKKFSQETIKRFNENRIEELESKIVNEKPGKDELATINTEIESCKKIIQELDITRELEYEKDPMYKSINDLIYKSECNFHNIVKSMIIGSYTSITESDINRVFKKFKIIPSAFGENDTRFSKRYTFKDTDINRMAPFKKLNSKKSGSSDLMNIKSTNLIKNNINIKYISPRNYNIKRIYVYLQSKEIHGENYMYNPKMKERLSNPLYSTLISAMDEASSGFFNVGLGKRYVDTINTIESAYYDYTKTVEKYLKDPAKQMFLSFNDMKPLPEPISPPDKSTSSNPNSSSKEDLKQSTGKTIVSEYKKEEMSDKCEDTGNTNSQGVVIYKPKDNDGIGIDADGNIIYGYPSEDVIRDAILNGLVGYPSKENPNGFPVDPDGNVNPIIGYDENGKAIYGRPTFYPDDYKIIGIDKYGIGVIEFIDNLILEEYSKNGKELLDIKGNEATLRSPVTCYNSKKERIISEKNDLYSILPIDHQKDELGKPLPNQEIMGYDKNGNRVLMIDKKGRTIIKYRDDRNKPIYKNNIIVGYEPDYRNPVYGKEFLLPIGKDSKGKFVYGYDKIGNPIYGFNKDCNPLLLGSDGEIVVSTNGINYIIGYDVDGRPIYGFDINGRPIYGYDKNGKPIIGFDKESGKPIIGVSNDGLPIFGTPIIEEEINVKLPNVSIDNSTSNDSLINNVFKDNDGNNGDIDLNGDLSGVLSEIKENIKDSNSGKEFIYIIGF